MSNCWNYLCRGLAAACLLAASGTAAAWLWNKYPVPVKDRPDWVEVIPVELGFTVPGDISQGIYHLLVDTQVRAPKSSEPEYFYHYARHIANQAGVEQGAQIHIDYNPAYQSLRLHEVAVWRGGRKIDRLGTARMNLVNREKELDQLLYSGEQTLHLVLDDIAVGDILEYSYTIGGYNPIYDGIFAFSHATEWSVPLHRLSVIVYWQRPQPLYYKLNGGGAVRILPDEDGTRYVLDKTGLAPLVEDENTPQWFDPRGVVRFSESESWQDVADWARPLLEGGVSSGHAIQKIATDIAKSAVDRKHRIALALQYVQAEVRYFGIEIGENSHRPSKAEETLTRRYGDCKDKTVLLLSILRALGVEAYAALVNTRLNRGLADALPAINLFDHVIVSVFHEGTVYWLDPSRQYQYGSLGAIHQPDYGYALVLKPGAAALTEARPQHQAYSVSELKEIFDLSAGPEAPALYAADTTVTGLNAEKLRRSLASTGRISTQKEYLNFYKRFYPSIQPVEAASFKDWPELNEMEIKERYSIGSIWEENSKTKKHFVWIYAHAVTPYLRAVKSEERRHPLALNHPVNIRQFIEVRLHDYRWDFEDDDFTEGNPFFSFSRTVRFDKPSRKLLIEYKYTSKTDFVSPEDIESYNEAYEAVVGQSRYGIFIKPGAFSGGVEKKAEPDYALYLAGAYLLLLAAIFTAWRVQQRRRPYTGETLYFPVALPKFVLMWLCSCGFYGCYWFYRNWQYVKQRDRSSILPALRGVLYPFWFYALYAELRQDNAQRDPLRSHLPPPAAGTALALSCCALVVVAAVSVYTVIPILAALLLVLPLANYVNFVNQDAPAALRYNSRWRPRHLLLILLGAPLLLALLGSETGLMPGEKVVEGQRLSGHDLKFLQRRGIVHAGDEIRYFYSDSFINIREDGNGFSNRHVFAYWKEDGQLILESAAFDEIKDIKVIWGQWNSDTVIEVIRRDDSRFTLYAAAFGNKDRLFVDALLEHWKDNGQLSMINE